MIELIKLDDLRSGLRFGPSSWFQIEQARIDAFADATDDHQWIHVDPERAADGPYGTTIAHGWLTMSLMAPFTYELLPLDASAIVSYGADRVRFPAAVPVGSRLRATFDVSKVKPVDGGFRVSVTATVEREHETKPVCIAELVFIAYR